MMEQDLFIQYKKNPSIELRNKIVEKYLYMVDILIRKYLGKGVDYDDLYQVGALALVSAVERFDPDRGFEFSSFATPTILGEIKKYFRDKQWSLKVPRRLKEIAAKVQEAKEELYSKYQRKPTVEEIAKETGYTERFLWTRPSTISEKTVKALFLRSIPDSMKKDTSGWKIRRSSIKSYLS